MGISSIWTVSTPRRRDTLVSSEHSIRALDSTDLVEERLVHGPLTALMLLEAFSMHYPSTPVKSFEYRAVNPLVVNRRVAICGKEHKGSGVVQVWAEDAETKAVGMLGRIQL
ncbi:uncharacterized protein B0H18DRAFT_979339 [Fomitopsis serialis]|uniref:uncharacterized protein n=1 Tax=Fomitopsis serialis TaxID=139415 RepID=UPI002008A070|nr:uncharacterized protein B0H18DRAFT_979339 [Neoantrodia serialis]KAH9934997.1 hypothetical protein B0H18DRAFT_979339 [Neoantrodia serialis]